jgi:hypothetical protein
MLRDGPVLGALVLVVTPPGPAGLLAHLEAQAQPGGRSGRGFGGGGRGGWRAARGLELAPPLCLGEALLLGLSQALRLLGGLGRCCLGFGPGAVGLCPEALDAGALLRSTLLGGLRLGRPRSLGLGLLLRGPLASGLELCLLPSQSLLAAALLGEQGGTLSRAGGRGCGTSGALSGADPGRRLLCGCCLRRALLLCLLFGCDPGESGLFVAACLFLGPGLRLPGAALRLPLSCLGLLEPEPVSLGLGLLEAALFFLLPALFFALATLGLFPSQARFFALAALGLFPLLARFFFLPALFGVLAGQLVSLACLGGLSQLQCLLLLSLALLCLCFLAPARFGCLFLAPPLRFLGPRRGGFFALAGELGLSAPALLFPAGLVLEDTPGCFVRRFLARAGRSAPVVWSAGPGLERSPLRGTPVLGRAAGRSGSGCCGGRGGDTGRRRGAAGPWSALTAAPLAEDPGLIELALQLFAGTSPQGAELAAEGRQPPLSDPCHVRAHLEPAAGESPARAPRPWPLGAGRGECCAGFCGGEPGSEPGSSRAHTLQLGVVEHGLREICPAQVGVAQVGVAEICASEVRVGQPCPTEVGSARL